MQHLISRSRHSMVALLTLGCLAPVLAACDRAPRAAYFDDPAAEPSVPEAPGEPPAELQYSTSESTIELTGMTYYTVENVGPGRVVRGFLPDGTLRATVELADEVSGLSITLGEPGQGSQRMVIDTVAIGDQTYFEGSIDGQPFSFTLDANLEANDGIGFPTYLPLEAAQLLAQDYTTDERTGRGRARACFWCGVGLAGAALVAWFLYSSGLGATVIAWLANLYRFGGMAAVASALRERFSHLSNEALAKLIAAATAFFGAAIWVVNNCIDCITGATDPDHAGGDSAEAVLWQRPERIAVTSDPALT